MTIDEKDLRILFDLAVNSMDFGSGFMVHEDVEALRRVAAVLGVPDRTAIPSNFRASYAHEFEPGGNVRVMTNSKAYFQSRYNPISNMIERAEPKYKGVQICSYCRRRQDLPCHNGVSVTEPTQEYEA